LKRKDETLHDVNIKQEPEGGLEKEDVGTHEYTIERIEKKKIPSPRGYQVFGREGWSLLRRTDLHHEGM
jgi:hypothetical protein